MYGRHVGLMRDVGQRERILVKRRGGEGEGGRAKTKPTRHRVHVLTNCRAAAAAADKRSHDYPPPSANQTSCASLLSPSLEEETKSQKNESPKTISRMVGGVVGERRFVKNIHKAGSFIA